VAGGLKVELVKGLCPSIDVAAAAAPPDRRFLVRAWFGDGPGLRTLSLRSSSNECLAALPLQRRGPVSAVPGSYWPFRSFPVADVPSRHLATLLRTPAARRALGLAFRLGPVCEDDPALALLTKALAGASYTLIQREVGRCFVHRVEDLLAEGPWPHASAIQRNARRERQLQAHGPVQWRFVRGAAWTAEIFDQLAAIEQASWLGETGGDRKFSDPDERRRWERLAQDPSFSDYMSACLLLVGDRPAAFSFDLDVGTTRFGIASGYDPAFHQQSPGRLLHYRNTEEAIRRGIRLINWGCGDSGYKRQLGATPGPRLLDCLFVRNLPGFEALARRLWRA
jgi:hypothetical protein